MPKELDSNSKLERDTIQEDNDFYSFISNVGSIGNRWELLKWDSDFFILFPMGIVIKTGLYKWTFI